MVPGPVWFRHALHGGAATHDPIDARHLAGRLHGGTRLWTDVDSAARRAPRDLLQRWMPRMRTRAVGLTHGLQTPHPYHLLALRQHLTDHATRGRTG